MSARTTENLLPLLVNVIDTKFQEHVIANQLLRRLIDKLKELQHDERFLRISQSHVKTLSSVIPRLKNPASFKGVKFISAEECVSFHISKLFLDKINLYSLKAYGPFQTSYAEPIESIPIEFLLKPDRDTVQNFENSLQKNDILYAEVVNPDVKYKDKEYIQLRIISKDGLNGLVYHLNVNAIMFKSIELPRLNRTEIAVSEILKVVVLGSAITEGVKKHYVTTNPDAARNNEAVSLGIVSPSELPFKLESFKVAAKFSTYAHYLRSHLNFYHSRNLKDLIRSVGLDPYRIYSFSEKRDGLTFPADSCIEALMEVSKLGMQLESQKYAAEAKKFADKKDFEPAFAAFDEALKCWPKNHKAYELRGKMYIEMSGMKSGTHLKKGCLDFETALQLNPGAQIAKQSYSDVLSCLADRFKEKKKYAKAKEYVLLSMKLNKEHHSAANKLKWLNDKIDQKNLRRIRKEKSELKDLERQREKIHLQLKTER